MPPPQHWGNDELTKFLDSVHKNQFATFVQKPETKRIIGIDESFVRVLEEWINPRDLTAALLMFRAHSAYRAAASCAFSGQSAELHSLLRLMLEQWGYANLINRKPELGEVWLNRHESDADRAKVEAHLRLRILGTPSRPLWMNISRTVIVYFMKGQLILEPTQTR